MFQSAREAIGHNRVRSVLPASGWVELLTLSAADGYTIDSPWELDDFIDPQGAYDAGLSPLGWETTRGGRILVAPYARRLEILPLFSTAGASGTLQLFGFDYADKGSVSPSSLSGYDPNSTVAPIVGEQNLVLGTAYPMSRDDSGAPQTVAISSALTSEFTQVNMVNNSQTIGGADFDVWFVGLRHFFSPEGMFAFFPWVPTLSTGSLMLLARGI